MNTSSRTIPRVVTRDDLSAALEIGLQQVGFDQAQINRLGELKAAYPYLEFTDSIEEWRRLSFLKWRRSTGRLRD